MDGDSAKIGGSYTILSMPLIGGFLDVVPILFRRILHDGMDYVFNGFGFRQRHFRFNWTASSFFLLAWQTPDFWFYVR